MGAHSTHPVDARKAALSARLAASRENTSLAFGALRAAEESASPMMAISRDNELAAMLKRISLRIPEIVYGEVPEELVVQSGLPQHLRTENQIS